MSNDKFANKIAKIENLLIKNANQDFYLRNFIGIQTTISTYLVLKEAYNKFGVFYYADFIKSFSQFYGIKRFVDDDFIMKYFKKMEDLRGREEYDVMKLTNELIDSDGKIQFSFATKMLNIMNDKKYPIYDSNVVKSFGIYTIDSKILVDKVEDYVSNYTIIENVYNELLIKHQNLIKDFRSFFKCTSDDLSDMRIIDIIVWKIGENLGYKK